MKTTGLNADERHAIEDALAEPVEAKARAPRLNLNPSEIPARGLRPVGNPGRNGRRAT